MHKLVVMNNIKSNNLLMFQGVSLDKEKDNIYMEKSKEEIIEAIKDYVNNNYE